MRTHGDDVAQALALLGVRPLWRPETGRVIGVEAVPLADLGRPRVDVTVHLSGFFRDAFPHLVDLLDRAVRLVAALWTGSRSADNPIAAHVRRDRPHLGAHATARLFGSKPGCYGAGLLPLIDSRHWETADDLARAYETWGAFAYGEGQDGAPARDAFRARFGAVEVALKNQDNREHDLFDSDDYFQYHGGMIAAVRAIRGAPPAAYFGDSADPRRPAVRSLHEEARRVFRTRVANPRWLAAMRRHGYKGAMELRGDRRLPLRLRRHRRRRLGLDVRDPGPALRPRSAAGRRVPAQQSLGPARRHRPAPRSRLPWHVGPSASGDPGRPAPAVPQRRGRPRSVAHPALVASPG